MSEKDREKPRSDAEVREAERARVGGGPVSANDAVERRAVGAPGTVVRNRRAQPDESVPRAESRGIYRDAEGRRRVVGAGQVIPAGYDRIESATIEDRVGVVPTAQEDLDGEQTSSGGGRRKSGGAK